MKYFFSSICILFTFCVYGQNDSICSVQITLDSSVTPRLLITTVTGTPPFIYEWSNGRKTEKIILNQSGKYAVTITDATGCFNYDEFEYDQCRVEIIQDRTESEIFLKADVVGTPPFQYYWGTDETIQSILPNGTGSYVVTISDATGCSAAAEIDYLEQELFTPLKTIAENKIWQTVIYPTFSPEKIFINYQFLNDTIIHQQAYKQLFSKNYSLPIIEWKPTNLFLREKAGNIYVLNNDLSETLLYDFSLSVNDTFDISDNNRSYDCRFIVTAVDSLRFPDNTLRKRITLIKEDDPNPAQPEYGTNYWVEGIGSLTSLVNYGRSCYTDYDLDLLCFYENNTLIYGNERSGNCLLTTIIEPVTLPIRIFPNPSQSSIFIESKADIGQVQLYDGLGREIKINTTHQEIDISHLSNGMYFLHIQTKQAQFFMEKIIKIN